MRRSGSPGQGASARLSTRWRPGRSPAQITEKLLALPADFGNDLFGVGFEGFFHTAKGTWQRL
ncbi:hypothetical protein ACU635_37755 [[Actinomadura] parvosata]|uniref:hypothetical protein n=1 Tax=[Actinomadura] parvosata TaxID=1955412 RepID=UPI00406CA5FD